MIAMMLAAVGFDAIRHQTRSERGTWKATQDRYGKHHTHPALRRGGKRKR